MNATRGKNDSFFIAQADRDRQLLDALRALHAHHRTHCAAYAALCESAFPRACDIQSLQDVPYVPIELFKQRRLVSVDDSTLRVTVRSSGTTGQRTSRIHMDAIDARATAATLAQTLQALLGAARIPMLFIDQKSILDGGRKAEMAESAVQARAAAILGLMPLGFGHVFALNDDLSIDEARVIDFINRTKGQPIVIYGFTYLLWTRFLSLCEKGGLDLSHAIMLHSGGWKKLKDEAVSEAIFKRRFQACANIQRIINFYGMAETPGTIFVENAQGYLVPPAHADVIIRDPLTFDPMPDGEIGLVQILNALPRSYPGHSLLTEDLGRIICGDDGDGSGKRFQIMGRVDKVEMRGCSDVLAFSEPKAFRDVA